MREEIQQITHDIDCTSRDSSSSVKKMNTFIITAIKNGDFSFADLSKELYNNHAILVAFVTADWTALKNINSTYITDQLIAIGLQQDIRAIQYAVYSQTKFVNEAIRKNGLALQFASKKLRKDPEIIARATTQNPVAIKFALPENVPKPTFKI